MSEKQHNLSEQEVEARAHEILSHFFESSLSSEETTDAKLLLRVSRDERSFLIEVESTSRRGIDDMRGRLSTAVLELRKHSEPAECPIAMLHTPKVGKRALQSLEAFMGEFASDVGWGVFDDRSTVRLKIDELGIDHFEQGATDRAAAQSTTHNKRAFTDLNRWLLKVLMLQDAPEGMWHEGELREPVKNPSALARVAEVSQAKAYQFARTFRDLGWLRWSRGDFELSDRRGLFDAWCEEEKQLRVEQTPARMLFPTPNIVDSLEGERTSLDFAIGGFEACSIHGVLHTASGKPKLHAFGSIDLLIQEFDLEVCEERDADLLLLDVPYEESIRRGVLQRYSTPVVDVLQAALDVSHEPRRGREQADYIVGEVLGWDSWT